MNKHNLIKFGAMAQKMFDMEDDFKIMEIPSDAPTHVRLAVPAFQGLDHSMTDYVDIRPMKTDTVTFVKFGSTDNYEYIRAGYSRLTNTLVIQDTRDNAS